MKPEIWVHHNIKKSFHYHPATCHLTHNDEESAQGKLSDNLIDWSGRTFTEIQTLTRKRNLQREPVSVFHLHKDSTVSPDHRFYMGHDPVHLNLCDVIAYCKMIFSYVCLTTMSL